LGLLVFASQVIFASRLYLRSGYALVNAVPDSRKHAMVTISAAFRQDCAWWRKLMLKSEYCGMILDKWTVSDSFVAWDASMWGMGGITATTCSFQSHGQTANLLEWQIVT